MFFDKLFKPPHTDQTSQFYDDLSSGKISKGLWGKSQRFEAENIAEKASVKKYFLETVKSYLSKTDNVLDLGCGPGGFLLACADQCLSIKGIDISPQFINECQALIQKRNLSNAEAILADGKALPFESKQFDAVIMVDVLHHLTGIDDTLQEITRVLKPGGKLIVFEPNKLNPLLCLLCILDKNEWGLLSLGTRRRYRTVLEKSFFIKTIAYNGLLIGPSGSLSLAVTAFLNRPFVQKLLGWLNPKIVIIAENNKRTSNHDE